MRFQNEFGNHESRHSGFVSLHSWPFEQSKVIGQISGVEPPLPREPWSLKSRTLAGRNGTTWKTSGLPGRSMSTEPMGAGPVAGVLPTGLTGKGSRASLAASGVERVRGGGAGGRVVRISQQLWRPLLTGQPCPGSTELSTHTAHVPCAPKASGTPTLPGWKQLQKLCQLHSDALPAWALGPAVLTHSRFKSSCASFLGQYTEMPFHGSPVSAELEQCKIYTDSISHVQGEIDMYLHF